MRKKKVKYVAYLLQAPGKLTKIAEANTLEEIRKKSRKKRRQVVEKTGEWAQILIEKDRRVIEVL